ncbi:MAG: serine/threonine-protein kinase RsbW [Thermoleophilaceae bacterium]|jgi:anti-sigma regulatory factor (Ser/Thr protein kinase)|nr:serine/threonine-protein kinase RsbW [Thermoleophilaceae bacterium]
MTEAKTASFSMSGGKLAASVARRSVLSIGAGLPLGVRHRVALLLSELVTNAVQHGGAGPDQVVEVRVASSERRVRVEVIDPGWNGGEPLEPDERHGGYGLLLVEHLSDGWGREATAGGGTLAWFELNLDAQAER